MFGISSASLLLFLVFALLSLTGPIGCASGRSAPTNPSNSGPFKVTVVGDWNDVEASLYAVVGDAELAVISKSEQPDLQVFELLSIGDESGIVYARRNPADGADEIPITVWCSLGFFGDPAAERSLTTKMTARLKDLAGVGARPIR